MLYYVHLNEIVKEIIVIFTYHMKFDNLDNLGFQFAFSRQNTSVFNSRIRGLFNINSDNLK